MLDENLPSFLIKPSDNEEQSNTLLYTVQGSEPLPHYILWKPDPRTPGAQNRYAVALRDPFNADVIYGEVVVEPGWTQPTLSAAEMRALNGAPGIPTPVVPNSFAIQLYNPDQQIVVKYVGKTLGGTWDFMLPKNTFRLPSASTLDRSLDDPAASAVTPKLILYWKKDSLISLANTPNLTCYMSGKSPTDSRKTKEPDITIAMFRSGKEITIYEPNLNRVDVEDKKGLELVILLGAQAIKDLYLNPNNKDLFNLSKPSTGRKNSTHLIGSGRRNSGGGTAGLSARKNSNSATPASQALHSLGRPHTNSGPHATDPRTQFVLDAETQALRSAIAEEEARERKAREKQAQEDARAVRKMLEQEERERTRKQAEDEKETVRLRKQYGIIGSPQVQASPYHAQFSDSPAQISSQMNNPMFPPPPTQPTPQFSGSGLLNRIFSPAPGQQQQSSNSGRRRSNGTASPYMRAPASVVNLASQSSFFNHGNRDPNKMAKKRSVHF